MKDFSILIWQKGELVPFDGVSSDEVLERITYAEPEEIISCAAQRGSHHKTIPVEELYLINHMEIHHFLNEDKTFFPEGSIDLSYFQMTDIDSSHLDDTEILEKLKNSKPAVSQISITQYPFIPKNFLYLNASLGVPLENAYTSLNLSTVDLYRLKNDSLNIQPLELANFSNISSLTIIGTKTSLTDTLWLPPDMSNLKRLSFKNSTRSSTSTVLKVNGPNKLLNSITMLDFNSSDISSEVLLEYLAETPNLEYLNLADCSTNLKTLPILKAPLLNLKSLNLNGTTIAAEHLKNFLNYTPFLEELCLAGLHHNEIIKFDDLGYSFNNLKYLDLSNPRFNSQELGKILMSASNLQHLKVRSLLLFNPMDFRGILKSLHYLDLRGGTISSENLEQFLLAAPNLKVLHLGGCGYLEIKPFHFNFEGNLAFLETLTCEKNNSVSNFLPNILSNAPYLKRLSLKACTFSERLEINGIMPNLEYLDIHNYYGSGDNLLALVKSSPRLKELSLEESYEFVFNEKLDVNLPALKILNLTSSWIASTTLKKLLEIAPNLEELNLKKCNNIKDPLGFGIATYPFIKKIDVSDSSIDLNNLYDLIHAPNLQHLNLANNTVQINILVDSIPRSQSLESLNLSGLKLTKAHLYQIMAKAPNLKSLEISYGRVDLNSLTPELVVYLKRAGVNVPEDNYEAEKDADVEEENFDNYSSSQNPTHNFKDHLQKIIDKQEPFKFEGTNQTKNQGMIIEKLCHYLNLTNQHPDWIARMQSGICNGLCHYCAHLNSEEWNDFINSVHSWNGNKASLSADLTQQFKNLLKYIFQFQFKQSAPKTYVGEQLEAILNHYQGQDPLIITNPWHAVLLKKLQKGNGFIMIPIALMGAVNSL